MNTLVALLADNPPPDAPVDDPFSGAPESHPAQRLADNLISPINMDDSNDEVVEDLANYGPSLEEHEKHIRKISKRSGSKSTAKQYGRKTEEYDEFSQAIFGSTEITVERVYKFLQFQAHRPKRTQVDDTAPEHDFATAFGGNTTNNMHNSGNPPRKRRRRLKKTSRGASRKYVFCVSDYKKVMDSITEDLQSDDNLLMMATNRIQSIEKYYNAILDAASTEIHNQIKSHPSILKLVNNVKKRTKMLKVNGDCEEVCRVEEKFRYPELYPKIEHYLWHEHGHRKNWKFLAGSMRSRYTFLSTTQTCTRHEATVSGMLSAFNTVQLKLDQELEPYSILVCNIYAGKNNQEDSQTILQHKSIRHKDPKLCEQGGLAIYLFCRFYVTDEEFELDKLRNWKKVRTTVGVNQVRREQFLKKRFDKMSDSTYYDKISHVFEQIGSNASHVLHFGRSCIPVLLELAEVMTSSIDVLANWNFEVYNQHYSLNLPFDALRVAAGFRKEKGFYHLPRSHLRVPDELKSMVFPNVTRAKELFLRLPKQVQYQSKQANKFLRVMDCLAEIFIQDCCQLRLEGRGDHLLFTHPLFTSDAFLHYEQQFLITFKEASDPRNDPTLDPVMMATPLIGAHLGDLKFLCSDRFTSMGRQMHMMANQVNAMHQMITQQQAMYMHQQHVMDGALNAHINSPYRDNATTLALPTSPQHPNPQPTQTTTEQQNLNEPGAPSPDAPHMIPSFDRLAYSTIEQIYNDWFGKGDSHMHLSVA